MDNIIKGMLELGTQMGFFFFFLQNGKIGRYLLVDYIIFIMLSNWWIIIYSSCLVSAFLLDCETDR